MSDLIVLDSHIWFWWINLDQDRLSAKQRAEIESASRVGVSSVSCFELALAHQRGRLEFSAPVREWFTLALSGSNIELLPVTPLIAASAVELTEVHRAPFDRIIIATTVELDARLISVDGHFASYPELSGRLIAK